MNRGLSLSEDHRSLAVQTGWNEAIVYSLEENGSETLSSQLSIETEIHDQIILNSSALILSVNQNKLQIYKNDLKIDEHDFDEKISCIDTDKKNIVFLVCTENKEDNCSKIYYFNILRDQSTLRNFMVFDLIKNNSNLISGKSSLRTNIGDISLVWIGKDRPMIVCVQLELGRLTCLGISEENESSSLNIIESFDRMFDNKMYRIRRGAFKSKSLWMIESGGEIIQLDVKIRKE